MAAVVPFEPLPTSADDGCDGQEMSVCPADVNFHDYLC